MRSASAPTNTTLAPSEKNTVAWCSSRSPSKLRHSALVMDIVSEPGVIILRRSDGSEVAKFSMLGATLEEIERATQEDYHRDGE